MKRWMLVPLALLLSVFAAMPLAAAAQPADNGGPGNSGAAKQCQKGSWAALAPADNATVAFANQDECVSYGAQGGTIVDLKIPTLSITFRGNGGAFCAVDVHLRDFAANTTYTVDNYAEGYWWGSTTITTNDDGDADYMPYTYYQYGPFARAVANNGVDSGLIDIAC